MNLSSSFSSQNGFTEQFSNSTIKSTRAEATVAYRSSVLNQYAEKLLRKSQSMSQNRIEFESSLKNEVQDIIDDGIALQNKYDKIISVQKAVKEKQKQINSHKRKLLDKIHLVEIELASYEPNSFYQTSNMNDSSTLRLKIRNYENLLDDVNGKLISLKFGIQSTHKSKKELKKKKIILEQNQISLQSEMSKAKKLNFQSEEKQNKEQALAHKSLLKSNQSLLKAQFKLEESNRQISNTIKLCENDLIMIERKIKDQQYLIKSTEKYLSEIDNERIELESKQKDSQLSFVQVEVKGKLKETKFLDLTQTKRDVTSELAKVRSSIKQKRQEKKELTGDYFKGQRLVSDFHSLCDQLENLYNVNDQLEGKIETMKEQKIQEALDSPESVSVKLSFQEIHDQILHEIENEEYESKRIKSTIQEEKKKIIQLNEQKAKLENRIKSSTTFKNSNKLTMKQFSRLKAKEIQERMTKIKSNLNQKNNNVKQLEHKILLEETRIRERKRLIKQEKERMKPKSNEGEKRIELIISFYNNSYKYISNEKSVWESIDDSSDKRTMVNHWSLVLNQIFNDFDTDYLQKI